MCQAIDETSGGNLANTTKIIRVNGVDATTCELPRAVGHAVEHLVVTLKEMHGTQNEIEFVPILFDPFSSSRRTRWIIVELDAGTDS